jgi:hypothetical protein
MSIMVLLRSLIRRGWRGTTRTEAGNHAETLPKNFIIYLLVQDLDGLVFKNLLS